MEIKLIRHLERRSANAWPASTVEPLDGWLLRSHGGVTRRANSVWPNEDGGRHSLAWKLAQVEEFYSRRAQPARYQICPAAQPPDLDRVLAQRGYSEGARTCVQTAAIGPLIDRTATSGHPVTVADQLSDAWFDLYAQAEGERAKGAELRRDILQRITSRTGYALVRLDGVVAATGLGVLEEGWLGIFCMTTRPEFRRQGVATTVLHQLARWGERHGVSLAYLQVMEGNTAALGLYARAGFQTLYHYHYREVPL